MLDRDNILQRAVNECMEECYQKAQPSINYKELIEKVKSGEIKDSHENPVYNRYYLSQEEFEYIKNKYKEAYNIKSTWNDNIELLEEYLIKGGTKDLYVPETMDKSGEVSSGYKSYANVKSLKEQLSDIIYDDKQLNKVCDVIMSNIKDCKNFYRFDREEQSFEWTVCLGASPSSNKETVKKYWESQGVNLEIEDRNPLLFWDKEYYGEDFEDVFTEEYGINWKEEWDKKYAEQLAEKKAKRDAEIKEIMENQPVIHKFKIGDVIRCKNDLTARRVFAIQPDGYRVEGDFIPNNEIGNWYHCKENFKHCI